MSQMNPYAPPQTAQPHALLPGAAPGEGEGFWREGDCVVMSKVGCVLPNRCVVCNDAATEVFAGRHYWHTGWLYLTIVLSLLLYLILALVMRKDAAVALPLCTRHAKRRRLGKLIGWGGFLVSLGLLFAGAFMGILELLGVSVLGMLAAAIAARILTNVAQVKKIDDHLAWFKVGPAFLASVQTTAPQILARPMHQLAPPGHYPPGPYPPR